MSPNITRITREQGELLLDPTRLHSAFNALRMASQAQLQELPFEQDLLPDAASARALLALQLGVPPHVAHEGMAILRRTQHDDSAGQFRIGFRHALGMMAEALKNADRAYGAWIERFVRWQDSRPAGSVAA